MLGSHSEKGGKMYTFIYFILLLWRQMYESSILCGKRTITHCSMDWKIDKKCFRDSLSLAP